MEQFLLLLACHFVGDMAMQNKWMSDGKAKNLEINFYHVATYTAIFILFGANLSMQSLGVIFATHFVIDAITSRRKIPIWQDQILHVMVLVFVFFVTK